MKVFRLIPAITLAIGLLGSVTNLFAHGSGSGSAMDEFIVTRHFTGAWDQVDQESQGLSLEVIEQLDGSRKAVVYWYTYGADRQPTWFVGLGDLNDNKIEFKLKESTDVGFMQDALPGNESVHRIGTMTIVFDSCNSGVVTYETDHEEVGSGTFNIQRLTEVMNTHCSGGISDDMHADAMLGEQRIQLKPAREGITGYGHARYEDFPGHMEFDFEVDGLPDGSYHLHVGETDQFDFSVFEGHGETGFASPGETGKMMMTFDPRGIPIEIHDNVGVVLSSFDDMFEQDDHHQGDHEHMYDCEMGHGMGMGMPECVYDGEFIEIRTDLASTGSLPGAKGESRWEMNSNRVEFSVEIEDVPVGSYTLLVGNIEVGVIEAHEMHDGEVFGHITFRDPEVQGREHLDFEPRGQMIEVLQGENVILEVEFPTE